MLWRKQYRHFHRYRQIVNTFAKHGFGYLIGSLGLTGLLTLAGRLRIYKIDQRGHLARGERLCRALEELGPTFVKLGQLLSARSDLLPKDITRSLERLQDHVPPFAYALVKEQIENELGHPPEHFFASFTPEPIAAASIGQVHRARLLSGAEVVVKIQRPDITRTIETDLEILFDLARLVDRSPWGRIYNFQEMAHEFAVTLRAEMDYLLEGRNADRFRDNFAGDTVVYIPLVYWDYTTTRVLTMEYVDGTKINHFTELDRIHGNRVQLAKQLARVMLQMVLEHGFFHADPHPGNIAVLPGNMIVFMDFGMVGYLPEHLQKHFFELVLGFLKYDTRQIIKTILAMGVVRGPVDIRAFKRDVDRLREQYTYLPLSQINFSRAVSELFELAFRYHIRIPTELTMLARAFLTVEGLLQELDPQLSLLGVAKPYGKKLLRQRLTWSGMKQGLSTTVLGYSGFLRDFPGQMHRVMQKITEDELSVTLEHRNLYLLTAGLNRAAQWLAWSIGLLALSILITGLMISSVVCGQSTITFLYWELPVLTTGFVVAFCLLVGLSFKLLGMCRKNRE